MVDWNAAEVNVKGLIKHPLPRPHPALPSPILPTHLSPTLRLPPSLNAHPHTTTALSVVCKGFCLQLSFLGLRHLYAELYWHLFSAVCACALYLCAWDVTASLPCGRSTEDFPSAPPIRCLCELYIRIHGGPQKWHVSACVCSDCGSSVTLTLDNY